MNIQLLDNNMINKIAAGEVVERPVSVVKELTENSIDAGAKVITIEIKDGGISYIRISDNGAGIRKDELKTAFLRHATSKIRDFSDLTNVMTLGFRGEALAAISTVSQTEMMTKTADAVSGTKIEIHGGQIISFADTGTTTGTTVITRNLFYNTPARRKFLKKAATESGYIHELVQRLALAHPEISFKFINNAQNILATSGNGDLKTAVFYVYGKDVAKNLIEIPESGEKIKLSGFVCKPQTARGNRSFGNFFINGRYVKSPIAASAVEDAYKNRLLSGKFPIYILNMKLRPDCVDVNVHPSKLEVRFENDDEVYMAVFSAVKNALEGERENLVADFKWDRAQEGLRRKPLFVAEARAEDWNKYGGTRKSAKISENEQLYETMRIQTGKESRKPEKTQTDEQLYEAVQIQTDEEPRKSAKTSAENQLYEAAEIQTGEEPRKSEKTQTHRKTLSIFSDYKIAGQIFNTYWVIEQDDKMYLLDQHAAHERLLYEQYLEKYKTGGMESQLLIEGLTVSFTPAEAETVRENMDLFSSFGFEIEEFGKDIFILRALPFIFNAPVGPDFFVDIVDALRGLKANKSSVYEYKTEAVASISCKAAVKGNMAMSASECAELINALAKLENPFNCPHGRPTIISMSKYEIEKKFNRK